MKKGGAWEGRGKGKTSEMQDIFISNVEIDVGGACSQRGGVERRSRGSSPGVLPQRAHSPPRKPGSRDLLSKGRPLANITNCLPTKMLSRIVVLLQPCCVDPHRQQQHASGGGSGNQNTQTTRLVKKSKTARDFPPPLFLRRVESRRPLFPRCPSAFRPGLLLCMLL